MNQQPKSGRTTAAQQYRMLTIAAQQPHAHVHSSSICMDRALYSVGFWDAHYLPVEDDGVVSMIFERRRRAARR